MSAVAEVDVGLPASVGCWRPESVYWPKSDTDQDHHRLAKCEDIVSQSEAHDLDLTWHVANRLQYLIYQRLLSNPCLSSPSFPPGYVLSHRTWTCAVRQGAS